MFYLPPGQSLIPDIASYSLTWVLFDEEKTTDFSGLSMELALEIMNALVEKGTLEHRFF